MINALAPANGPPERIVHPEVSYLTDDRNTALFLHRRTPRAPSKPSRTFRKLRQSRPDNPLHRHPNRGIPLWVTSLGIPLQAMTHSLPGNLNYLCRQLALFRHLLVHPPEGRAHVRKITNLHYKT